MVDTDGFKWASDNWLVSKNISERILLVSSFPRVASCFAFFVELETCNIESYEYSLLC